MMSPDPASSAAYRVNQTPVSREAFYALACNPARSVAVEACAGAGKTWMLVSRILRALLDGCAPQDILAITFTKKAAGEMRERLNKELRRCASLPNAVLAAELQARGLSGADATRRAPELRTLHERVSALGRPVQVRTFHSWFAALLRSAPLSVLQELKLPTQYELLEDDAPAIDLVWPRFYAALASLPEEQQDFFNSVARLGRFQTIEALKKAVSKRVEFVLADAAGVVDASVVPFAQAFPDLAELAQPEAFFDDAQAPLTLWWDAARALGAASAPTFSAKGAELERALTGRCLAGVFDALLTRNQEPRKFGEKIVGIAVVRLAQQQALRLLAACRQHEAWQHQQRLARLTRVLLHAYADLKRERGWVDMNDVEGAALRLLSDAELSGWMQQRLDARVRHLLIDEFQDTNPLQWQALYGWLSAYAGAGPGEAPSVFLVGDPKQSIYRFRRAEPQVFQAAQRFVVDGLSGVLLSCDHTRRCARQVVQALNSVMLAAVEAGEYGAPGQSQYRAHSTESAQAGAVLVLPQVPREARTRNGDDGVEPEWRDSLVTPRVLLEDTYPAREAEQAADWIAAEVQAGRLLPGQMMVLARRRERLGWLHEALLARGVASEQPEKLDLADAPAVQDLVALLDALVSPHHHLSLARALKSPLFGFSDALLAQVARLRLHWTPPADDAPDQPRPPAPSWWAVLQRFAALAAAEQTAMLAQIGPTNMAIQGGTDAEVLAAAAARLRQYQGWVQTLPPHDALSSIFDHGDVLARFAQAEPAGQRAGVLAQLRDLLGQSLAVDGGRFLTPYRLVRALKAGGLKATAWHTPGAVRLLTIHGAKGLEAHTVLLLDTATISARPETMGVLVEWPGELPQPRRFVFLASEKAPPACAVEILQAEQQARALEEINALYVALTRAESRLVISSFEPHNLGAAPSWYGRLQPLAQAEPAAVPAEPDLSANSGSDGSVFRLAQLPALARATAKQAATTAAPLADVDDEPRRFGLALHRLLQWCPTPLAGFAWGEVHRRAVAAEFGLSLERALVAQAMAERMVRGEAAWAWDSTRVEHWGNEVALVHQGESLRLDRLVRSRAQPGEAATWWVFDFKTATDPERQPELLVQMRGYRAAMVAAYPEAPVRLAFINAEGRLIEVPSDAIPA
jgi:ATP-dependent helicase/nuclease subunit A